jgi:hypothetical protein
MHEALRVFLRACSWFARWYVVVAAFGVLASVQRFVMVGGGERFDWARGAVGETFTAAVRVAFLGVCVWLQFRDVDVPWSQASTRLGAFLRDHGTALLASGAILLVLTVAFKIVPDALIANLDGEARTRATAWALAIKNVTIIPFMMVWGVTLARHAIVTAEKPLPTPRPENAHPG